MSAWSQLSSRNEVRISSHSTIPVDSLVPLIHVLPNREQLNICFLIKVALVAGGAPSREMISNLIKVELGAHLESNRMQTNK